LTHIWKGCPKVTGEIKLIKAANLPLVKSPVQFNGPFLVIQIVAQKASKPYLEISNSASQLIHLSILSLGGADLPFPAVPKDNHPIKWIYRQPVSTVITL